jgi:ribosomal protein S18 acetylase RimI-like enzyme
MSDDLLRMQAAIRADAMRAREVETIGPFVCTFSAATANPFLNYAIPEAGARPSPAEVAELVAAYRRRGRKPRLEFMPGLAPAVEGSLEAAGFEVELRTPLMVFRGQARPQPATPDGVELVEASTYDEIRAAAVAQNEAYGDPHLPSDDEVRRVQAGLAVGGVLVLARDSATGEPAGAGACTAPHDGACELTSVGVRESYRRRGIAAALAARLASIASARGVRTVFLMAHGASEAAIYARVGFEPVGDVLHISLAEADPQAA